MPLNQLAQAFLDKRAAAGEQPVYTLTVEQAREQTIRMSALMGEGPAVSHTDERFIPGPSSDIPIRIYSPEGDGPFPILMYFHGGGWVTGNLETVDFLCRFITKKAGCIVISVNYRHAPEHPFPAAPEDAYAATLWASRNAGSFNGDPSRLAVAGASSGANLAAVTSLMARDRGGPSIIFQLLTVPVTNYGFDTPSFRENGAVYPPTLPAMEWHWDKYLSDPSEGANPYISPQRAKDLSGLPPAFVMTAQFDPLRDDGKNYADLLRAAGTAVTYKCYNGMIHMFLGPEAAHDMIGELRKAFSAS